MKSLQQIEAQYDEISSAFEVQLNDAEAAGDAIAIERVEQRLRINDQAYFVLCWGQLETEFNEACRAAIRRRTSNASWEMRRGFDFYNSEDKRLGGLTFDRRVAMVLKRNETPSGPYSRVLDYYEMRNKIAHGKLQATRIVVSAVVADFYVIQAELVR